jgi:hypothetical protein
MRVREVLAMGALDVFKRMGDSVDGIIGMFPWTSDAKLEGDVIA